jgi:hypothetical protein
MGKSAALLQQMLPWQPQWDQDQHMAGHRARHLHEKGPEYLWDIIHHTSTFTYSCSMYAEYIGVLKKKVSIAT